LAGPESSSYRDAVMRIQQQIENARLSDARASIMDALKEFPSDGGLENLLGVVDAQQGHFRAAQQDFTVAIQHDPSLVSAYLNLGRILMSSAQQNPKVRQKAVYLYEQALRRAPGNNDANFQLAILLKWQHHYRESLEHVDRVAPDIRAKARVQALLCADEAGIGSLNAVKRTAASLEANPNLTEQDVMLAVPELRDAHLAQVIAGLLRASNDHHPLSLRGLRLLGLAEEAEGETKLARATLERVYDKNPSWVAPLVDLTRVAMEQKDYKAALGYLAHARALRPDDASYAYEFGLICVKLGFLDETIQAMGDAVKLAPDNPEYNLSMGLISSLGFNPETALPYLMKYHSMDPKDPKGVLALGTGYFRAGKMKEASLWLQRATGFPTTAGRAHYFLGRILFQHGEYLKAVAELNEAARLQADRSDIYVELGKAYFQLKKYALAKKVLDRAIQLDPNSYNANLALLRVYSITHDPRRAEQQKRFVAVHEEKEKAYVDSLRKIYVRPLREIESHGLSTEIPGGQPQ
jgi:tetratricopeptide (TPR) repeat protein